MINIATLNAGDMSIVTGTPGPVSHPETRITFSDGSSDTYEWSGKIDQKTMIDAGLFDVNEYTWIKEPVTVDIGNTVTSLGDSAFNSCIGLTSVTISNSVTSIGNSAFSGCSGLTSVTIGNGVTSIEDYAFAACGALTSVTMPDGVTNIGIYAFAYCSWLTSVTIPNSVTSIKMAAFSGCSRLTNVTFLGKTLEQVQAMSNYSWGISDTSIINVA